MEQNKALTSKALQSPSESPQIPLEPFPSPSEISVERKYKEYLDWCINKLSKRWSPANITKKMLKVHSDGNLSDEEFDLVLNALTEAREIRATQKARAIFTDLRGKPKVKPDYNKLFKKDKALDTLTDSILKGKI